MSHIYIKRFLMLELDELIQFSSYLSGSPLVYEPSEERAQPPINHLSCYTNCFKIHSIYNQLGCMPLAQAAAT